MSIYKHLKGKTSYVVLTDDAASKTSFDIGIDKKGKFYIGGSSRDGAEEGDHTVNAFFSNIDIDMNGDGWRDIESGDYLEDFFVNVIFGKDDAQDFLDNI
jgi:hypothetical protein